MENLFHLPVKSYKDNGYKNFKSYISALFEAYKKEINTFRILNESEKQKGYELSETLGEIYSLYMSGFSGQAYKKFEKMIEMVSSEIDILSNVIMSKEQCQNIKSLYEKNINNWSNKDGEKILKATFNSLEYEYSDRFDAVYYRVRSITNAPEKLSKYEMFHQPFENHEEINNYRYSIAGFPCLYLGKSFGICNLEIGEKPFDTLWVMKYNLEDNLKCLDLSRSPNLLMFQLNKLKELNRNLLKNFNDSILEINKIIVETKKIFSKMNRVERRKVFKGINLNKMELINKCESLEQYTEELTKLKRVVPDLNKFSDEKLDIEELVVLEQVLTSITKLIKYKIAEFKGALVLFPLLMSCSIKVSNYNVFKPEYIMPQFLMQWLRTNDEYWGVKYISTKYDWNEQKGISNYYQNINVAIPARQWTETGYCSQLMKCFSVSEPVNLRLLVKQLDYNIIDSKLFNLETHTKF